MHKKKRRFITLIEIVIVMFLIAMITGVVAYNYTGTLEKGKAFKTEMGMKRLTDILNLAVAEDPDLANHIQGDWEGIIRRSPLVNNPNDLINDGWGAKYQVNIDANNNVEVHSAKYNDYRHGK